MVDVRPRDPLVGLLLGGRYRLLDVIGHGGTGRVYRAVQEPIGREVAVKLLHPDLDPDGEHDFQARFLREAALAGRVQHPNVVTVHDYGRTDDGACYIVMEHLRGRTLREVMRDGRLPLSRALRIFESLLLGLRAAHRAGLVHRDVKPSNLILLAADDGRDTVKLFDFGLVKGDDEATITHSGVFMGTPQYVSPEQARGDVADARSDLYSAGVILYRMVTGVLPYTADTPIAIAVKHARDPFPPMSARAPDVAVDPAVEAYVRRIMAKEAGDRFDDADAALRGLGELLVALQLDEISILPTLHARMLQTGCAPEDAPSLSSLQGVEGIGVRQRQHAVKPAAHADSITTSWAPGRDRRRAGLALAGVAALGVVGGLSWWGSKRWDGGPDEVAAAPPDDSVTAAAPVDDLPPPSPPPAEPREVVVLVSSTPAGAEVWLDDALLGTTPLARHLQAPDDSGGAQVDLRVHLDGYRDGSVSLDLSGSEAAGHVDLQSRSRPRPRPVQAPAETSGPVVADGVRFSAEEAAAALALVNEADGEVLRAAGIAPRQANILLDRRPFADLADVATTPFIGGKTLESLRAAVAP